MNKICILFISVILISCAVNKSTRTMHPYLGDQIGCGNFTVFKLSDDHSEFVSIKVDASQIELTESQMYVLEKADVVSVLRKKYEGSVDASLCNDIMMNLPELILEENANEGLIELVLNKDNLQKAKRKEPYRVTIILKKVVFDSVTIDYLQLDNVNVGWLPG